MDSFSRTRSALFRLGLRLLAGCVLVPLLGLRGCWVLAAVLIASMSAASLWLQLRRREGEGFEFSWNSRFATAALVVFGHILVGFFVPGDVGLYVPAFRVMMLGVLPFMSFCLLRHIVDARGGLAYRFGPQRHRAVAR